MKKYKIRIEYEAKDSTLLPYTCFKYGKNRYIAVLNLLRCLTEREINEIEKITIIEI